MDDQQRIQKFLYEFSSRLSKRFKKELDFILLFGSAARGEWKRGISDVDLIIQSRDQEKIEEISKEAEKIFWELDKKYDTKFKEVCSIADKKDPFKKVLKETRLYVPFEVFGPNDIDWIHGRIKKKEIVLGAELVAPQSMLFLKMKSEGKILYGRDIRKVIQVRVTLWDKIKALLVPFYVACLAWLIAAFFPKTALKMADKAVLYSIESFLYFLDKPIGRGMYPALKEFRKELKDIAKIKYSTMGAIEIDLLFSIDYKRNFDFAKKAIKIKYNWQREQKEFGRWDILKFCWQAVLFTNTMNWQAILKSDKNKTLLRFLVLFRSIALLALIVCAIFYIRSIV